MEEFHESDWKLLRKKLPDWQERFMGRLCGEYMALLNSGGYPSKRFWALEKRIRQDCRKAGVVVSGLSRSRMHETIARLVQEGAITLDELSEFSADLQERIRIWTGLSNYMK